ncbi:MAG: ankyrin repeat domain-containing protein [Candidatus Eremiobacteraeota bacterium]|nr:ankyrin repeat domain-containing protein [Candidatus Eremiobacteraeota bacterium]
MNLYSGDESIIDLLGEEIRCSKRKAREYRKCIALFRARLAATPELLKEERQRKVTILHWAVKENFTDVAELLISRGADVNALTINGVSPLHWACEGNSLEMVDLLIRKGARLNARDRCGRTPLYRALRRSRKRIAAFLIMKGAVINRGDLSVASVIDVPKRELLHAYHG